MIDAVRRLGVLLACSAAVVRPGAGPRLDVADALRRAAARDALRPAVRR